MSSREPCKHCYYFCFTKQLMTLFICMYVHCIGYRQRSVSVVMAPEPHSKSSFNLFFSVCLKREKILVEICSKVHEWIFFLCSHDFCLSNSPEWSNSFPMKKTSKHLRLGIARKNIFVKCGFMAQVVFTVFALQNGLWPAKDSKTFNCGLIPTTEGPDTRYSLPKSPTKRVPIT